MEATILIISQDARLRIADDLQKAAQVVEMLLIKDHSRMKREAMTPYDSTHEQQHRLPAHIDPKD